MTLSGKTVLVTGAAGAIGAAVAQRLAEDGARPILVDVAYEELAALKSQIGGNAEFWPLDLSDVAATSSAAAAMTERYGKIDILVNNAGILSNHKLAETTMTEWRRVHMINVEAALVLIQALVPMMRAERWGRIINMSSYAAKSGGLTAGTAYSASKAALVGLTFAVAREIAADGITVNAIAPAYVISPMVSQQLNEEQRQHQLSQIPVGRFCTPEEVAHTVAFLASPMAGFITGEVIDMNGGLQFD